MDKHDKNIATRVREEHLCIQRDINKISEEMHKEIKDSEFDDWKLEFTWRLRDFRTHLLKHFDLEEEGGFMQEILELAPETKNRITTLSEDHTKIINSLDESLTKLKELESPVETNLQNLRSKIVHLMDRIHSHEIDENELIQKVYYQEYGYPS